MSYVDKLNDIFEAGTRRDFLKTMGKAASAASNIGKVDVLGMLSGAALGTAPVSQQVDIIADLADIARRSGLGSLLTYMYDADEPNTSYLDTIKKVIEKLRDDGQFNEQRQIESIISDHFLSMSRSDRYDDLDKNLEMSPDISGNADSHEYLHKMFDSDTISAVDVKIALRLSLHDLEWLFDQIGINVPSSVLATLSKKYLQQFLTDLSIVYNPVTNAYDNNYKKRMSKDKNSSKPEKLEHYKIPKDYEYGEPMHQPFESKLNKVLSCL